MKPREIIELFKSDQKKDQDRAYQVFLKRTHYDKDQSADGLKRFACKQLNVNCNKIISAGIRKVPPGVLWATQDSVREDKLEMVRLAHKYVDKNGGIIPPVIVWNLFDSQAIRYILQDGHHRAHFSYHEDRDLSALVLEPIGNYGEVEDKLSNAFKLRKRVISLPIKKTKKIVSKRFHFNKVQFFTRGQVKEFSLDELKELFETRDDPMLPELAYMAFLAHGSWGFNFDIKRGVKHVKMDLDLPLYEGKGLDYSERKLNPNKIWASEDSLDYDKIEMVKAAMEYMLDRKKPIPPVIVWLIKHRSKYNLVAHDGHHRIFVAHLLKIRIPAVVLEYWLDSREDSILERKIHYARINTYVKDMPIEKFNGKVKSDL